jgi:hypothetical protein
VITGKSDPNGRPVEGSIDDDEEVVRVERLARPDHPVPPAEPLPARAVAILGAEPVPGTLGRRGFGEAGRVGIAAQRVADEDHVVASRREGAVRFVGHADREQFASTVEPDRSREVEEAGFDRSDRPGRDPGRWCRHPRDHIAPVRAAAAGI